MSATLIEAPGLLHTAGLLDPVEGFRLVYKTDPLEWQYDYLEEWRNAVVLKGRQVGASTCAGVIAVCNTLSVDHTLALVVSPSLKQSTEVKQRATDAARALAKLVGLRITGDSTTQISFSNGSRVVSLPGSQKSVRGWTADFLVIDEAAFLEPETFLAARATAATGGRVIVQSTPAGPFGHFYELWESEDPNWAKYRVTSEQVPTISAEFLANERRTLGADEYAQEYLATFKAPGAGLVSPERLKELTRKDAPPVAASPEAPRSVWDVLAR